VQALENSAPRDRRGSSEAGEAYVLRASSWGERGTRAAKCAGLGIGDSRGGICKERPLARKSGLRGVLGLAMMVWSSLDMRAGSRNFGEGSRRGVLSERERALGDLDFCGVCGSIAASSRSSIVSSPSSGVIAAVNTASIGCVHNATAEGHHSSHFHFWGRKETDSVRLRACWGFEVNGAGRLVNARRSIITWSYGRPT
jgi:hypothetical protein